MFGKKKPDPARVIPTDEEEREIVAHLAEAFVWVEMQVHAGRVPAFLSKGGFNTLRSAVSTIIQTMPDNRRKLMEEEVAAASERFIQALSDEAAKRGLNTSEGGDDVLPS